MFVLMSSRPSSKPGHLGSKTRSPGHISRKPCLHSSGHIFEAIVMNSVQNVCLDDFRSSLKLSDVELKTRSPGQNCKTLLTF